MALILKTGKTFNPAISETFGKDMTGSDYYGVIDSIEYDKGEKTCYFTLEIYSDNTARIDDSSTVDNIIFNYTDDSFDSDIGDDGLTIPQAYSKAIASLTDWESDE